MVATVNYRVDPVTEGGGKTSGDTDLHPETPTLSSSQSVKGSHYLCQVGKDKAHLYGRGQPQPGRQGHVDSLAKGAIVKLATNFSKNRFGLVKTLSGKWILLSALNLPCQLVE